MNKKNLFLGLLFLCLSVVFGSFNIALADGIKIDRLNAAVNGNEVTITWVTSVQSVGTVDYGKNLSYGSKSSADTLPSTNHSVKISYLDENTTYHYKITAVAGTDTLETFDQTFKTGDALDTDAPKFISYNVIFVTATSATIQWTTDEDSTTVVDYGLTNEYGKTKSSSERVKKHDITLTGLQSASNYFFRMKSVDKKGNVTLFSDRTFTTAGTDASVNAVLTLSNIHPITLTDPAIADTYATVSWDSSKPGTGAVYYGTKTDSLKKVDISGFRNFSHSLFLQKLAPGTLYYFKVETVDVFGKKATSQIGSFRTIDNATNLAKVTAKMEDVTVSKLDQAKKDYLLGAEAIDSKDTKSSALKISWTASGGAQCKVLYKFLAPGKTQYQYPSFGDSGWQTGSGSFYIYAPKVGKYVYKVGCYIKNAATGARLAMDYSAEQTFTYKPAKALLENSIIKDKSGTKIYLVKNGKKYWIADFDTIKLNNWQTRILSADSSTLKKYPLGGIIYGKFGYQSVVKAKNNPTVYYIEGFHKYAIPSPEVFLGMGYKWQDIAIASQAELDYYQDGGLVDSPAFNLPEGSLVKTAADHGVYLVQNKILRLIANAQAYTDNVYDWQAIKIITPEQLSALPLGDLIE